MAATSIYRLIWIILAGICLCGCTASQPLPAPASGGPDLNLGYEGKLDTLGHPTEWFLAPASGTITVVNGPGQSYDGDHCLLFSSRAGGPTVRNVCFNSLLVDMVRDSITLSAMVRATGDVSLRYGFFHQMEGRNSALEPVFTELPTTDDSTTWQQHTLTLSSDELLDYSLTFGFWTAGNGRVWLDDWKLRVDGESLEEATQAYVPPLDDRALTYLQEQVHPLHLDGSDQLTDPTALTKLVGGAEVVLLGEVTHGTKEFLQYRAAITRHLVEQLGFTAVLLEASLPELDRFNAALNQDLRYEALKEHINEDLNFWMYRTNDYVTFFRWLEQHNATAAQPVTIGGIDMQYPGYALDRLATFAQDTKDDALLELIDSLRQPGLLPDSAVVRADRLVKQVEGILLASATPPVAPPEATRLYRYAEVARWALNWRYRQTPYADYRDQQMADNIRWWQQRTPNRKVIVWAHNEHIRRSRGGAGYHLDRLRTDPGIVAIGLTTGRGNYRALQLTDRSLQNAPLKAPTPDTWEYAFAQTGVNNFLLDLRDTASPLRHYTTRRMRALGAVATPKQFFPDTLTAKFDAILYLDSSSTTVPY